MWCWKKFTEKAEPEGEFHQFIKKYINESSITILFQIIRRILPESRRFHVRWLRFLRRLWTSSSVLCSVFTLLYTTKFLMIHTNLSSKVWKITYQIDSDDKLRWRKKSDFTSNHSINRRVNDVRRFIPCDKGARMNQCYCGIVSPLIGSTTQHIYTFIFIADFYTFSSVK